MPTERNYYVICDDNCKFEGMTKEQIIAAIEEATGNVPSDVDSAFITKIKEMNRNNALKFWIGTNFEYNVLVQDGDLEANTMYIVTDEEFPEEITQEMQLFRAELDVLTSRVTTIEETLTTAKANVNTNWESSQDDKYMYKLIGNVAYFVFDWTCYGSGGVSDGIELPVELDVTGSTELYFFTSTSYDPSMLKYDPVEKKLYAIKPSGAPASQWKVTGTFSFPYKESEEE